MPNPPLALDKLVLDWNHRAVGRVREARLDARTGDVGALVVDLEPHARPHWPSEEGRVVIPVRFVHGVRREAIVLDRSLEALGRELAG